METFFYYLSSPYFIALLFFIIALTYSSVGLGGGSSYTALLAIFGLSTLIIPMISLTLNLLVTTVGSINFIRHKHANMRLILPFILSSIPMAYLGGMLNVSKILFYYLLLLSLIVVALRIYLWKDISLRLGLNRKNTIIISIISGGLIGFISGIVGIGGGVFLVPLIIMFGLGSEKQAAACGAIFIWVNSLSGLMARIQYNAVDITNHIPLMIAVLLGGGLGSYMGAAKISPQRMQEILGLIILIAIGFLINKLLYVS